MPHRQVNKKVNKLIITLYALMVLALSASLGVALYQNWKLKTQVIQSELARQAGVGNFIVENAIANATQSLAAAQRAMGKVLDSGPMSAQLTHDLLQETLNNFNTYSNNSYGGVLLCLDHQGDLVARTDQYPAERLNLSDRDYFRHFTLHPTLDHTIGPLVKARTTGEWVFHVAVPIRDKRGHFRGVLAQQIQAVDIAHDLAHYTDSAKTPQLVSQSTDSGISFVYPLELLSKHGTQGVQTPYADFARRSPSPQDSFRWPPSNAAGGPPVFVGYEQSQTSGLLTTIHLPVSEVWFDFLLENLFLLGITGMALLLTSGLFLHLYRVSNRLTAALYDSFSDALTQIPNRRSFENFFPRMLREAVRSHEPMAVLFIDIDHFKLFNDDFGHDVGDIALKAVAETLSNSAARPLDFVCRWGGEEFVVVLPHTTEAAATTLAEKILEAVRNIQLQDTKGRFIRHVTVSIGVSAGTVSSPSQGEAMVFEADEAMQHAKKTGRDRYVIHQQVAGWTG